MIGFPLMGVLEVLLLRPLDEKRYSLLSLELGRVNRRRCICCKTHCFRTGLGLANAFFFQPCLKISKCCVSRTELSFTKVQIQISAMLC